MINTFKFFYANVMFYVYFALLSMLSAPIAGLILLPAAMFFPVAKRRVICRYVTFCYGRIVMWLPYPAIRIKVDRPGGTGKMRNGVIVCNHRSAADAFLMAGLPSQGISPNVVQVVNLWPMRIPVLSWFARQAGYLSIKELTLDQFYDRGGAILDEGASIIAFPEGTRSGNREVGSFHGTVFRLASQKQVPIIPVCISGNENIPRKGSARMTPGTIHIRVLEMIAYEDYEDLSAFQLKQNVRTLIASELKKMDQSVS